MVMSPLNRRGFLQGAAAGAAALALPGAGEALASSPHAPVTLEFWNPASDPTGKVIITRIVDDFNKTVGKASGIFVKSRIVPVPTSAAYVKYTTAMTSSGSPDVVMTYEYTPVAAWAANGFIRPLDAYARVAGIKQSDFFPISWKMINFGGHIWGLLQEFDFNMLFWNKKIHKGPPPKSIPELDALAARYNKFDKKGNLIQVGIIPWLCGGSNCWDGWNTAWGGRFYDNTRGKWTINRPENRRFLEWYLKYVHMLGGRGKVDALTSATPTVYNAGDTMFWGKAAFGLEGEFVPLELKQLKNKLDYGITWTPTAPGVPYGTNVTGGGNLFLLPTKSPHPKEAATFIQYMGTKGVLPWNLGVSNIAPTKEAVLSASYEKDMPWIKPWVDALKFNHMVPPYPSPQASLFSQLMSNAVDDVTFKKKTPAQALAYVDQKIAAKVQEFKQFHPNWLTE
jgi:ABC-type glycerol-3-phosphate transport system substrate-binding protein